MFDWTMENWAKMVMHMATPPILSADFLVKGKAYLRVFTGTANSVRKVLITCP